MKDIKIFAPATVANVSCGFDAMGFALDNLGDTMIFRKNKDRSIRINKIEGAKLPFDIYKNASGYVAKKMLVDAEANFGIDIEIYKKYKPGSGLGSSAASSSGTAFAINELLDRKYTQLELVKYAMLGEEVACGSQIADNVAAALYGGFILVRSYSPLDIISIPTPAELYVTVIHPQIMVKTLDGRNVLPKKVKLKKAIKQWANLGGLVSGLCLNDYDLIARSIEDVIAEPVRKLFIPHFDLVKESVTDCGGLAAGISGSGPSIFALSKGQEQAQKVKEAMNKVYQDKGIEYNLYVSKIGMEGVRTL